MLVILSVYNSVYSKVEDATDMNWVSWLVFAALFVFGRSCHEYSSNLLLMANLLNISTFLYYGMTTLSFASGACVIMFCLSALTLPKVSPFIWELHICRFFCFWAKFQEVSLISRSTLIYRNMVCIYISLFLRGLKPPHFLVSLLTGWSLSLIFMYDVDHACTQMNIELYASTRSMEWQKNKLDF